MGGIDYFPQLISQFSVDWPIAVFLVQHVFAEHKSQLTRILSSHTSLRVKDAVDGEEIHPGHIYITPTDQHLIVKKGYVKTSYGPEENGSRPSINTLFRSAAVAYREQTIGILLTGLLTDGTRGMQAIKACGGVTIAQSPDEAPYSEMPQSAIDRSAVDHVAGVGEMGILIRRLLSRTPTTSVATPKHLIQQVKAAEMSVAKASSEDQEVLDNNASPLEDDALQSSLWSVLQFMQERTNMLENLSESERIKGRTKLARNFARKAEESKVHTQNLRTHLLEVAKRTSRSASQESR